MARLLTELIGSLARGQVDDISASVSVPNAATSITNGRIQPDGTCRRRQGSQRLHPTALGTLIYGLTEFTVADGTVQLCAFTEDTFWYSEDSGATWVDGTSSVSLDVGYWDFATMRVGSTHYLFAVNGGHLFNWDGATLTDMGILGGTPVGGKYLAVFGDRLYVTGHSGVIVQASAIGDPTTWTTPDGLYLSVASHDGNVPTGLYQIGPHLLVFSKVATSYIDGFGEETIIVAAGATGFSRSVGCIAFRTIEGVGESGVAWLSQRGIEYYTPGAGIRLVSRGVQKFLQSLNRASIISDEGIPCATYDWVSQEYWCALPSAGSTNDRVVIVNFLQQGTGWIGACTVDQVQAAAAGTTLYFSVDVDGYLQEDVSGTGFRLDSQGYLSLAAVGQGTIPTVLDASGYYSSNLTDALLASLAMRQDADRGSVVVSGGYDGFVRTHDGVNLDDIASDGSGGSDVELEIVSRPFLFGNPHTEKRVRVAHVQTIQDEAATITLSVRSDGVEGNTHDVTVDGTAFNQPQHGHAKVKVDGGQPQVVVSAVDDVRVAVLGLSAVVLRDRF